MSGNVSVRTPSEECVKENSLPEDNDSIIAHYDIEEHQNSDDSDDSDDITANQCPGMAVDEIVAESDIDHHLGMESDIDQLDLEYLPANDDVYVSISARLEAAAAAEAEEEQEEERRAREVREKRLRVLEEVHLRDAQRESERQSERNAANAVIAAAAFLPQSDEVRSLRPKKLAILDFPVRLEQLTRPFDDWLIPRVQAADPKVLYILACVITGMTAIELAFAVPFLLFALGLDGWATEAMYMAAVTALMSQVPKRFLWRWRPWMIGRAEMKKATKTSSFPSRAVSCSVVYSFCICYAAWAYGADTLYLAWFWMPMIVICSALLASWARVYLGVHYPSDCIIGAIQGLLICAAGLLLLTVDVLGCTSCREGECYSGIGDANRITPANLGAIGWWPLSLSTVVAILATVLFMMPPVQFWEKCERAFGLLAPCFVFQLGFLCPNGSSTGGSLAAPLFPPPWWALPFAVLVPSGAVGAIHLAGSRLPFLVFVLSFAVLFLALSLWRVTLLPVT